MHIHIRKATADDAALVALLARTSFKEAFGHVWEREALLNYFATTFAVAKIAGSLQKENNVYWLVFADDLPVGYAKLKKYAPYDKLPDPAPAQLQKIYVLNDFVGNGIGEKLQNALFEEVIRLRIDALWLAVWDGNDKAIRFYERHGFVKTTRYHYDFEKMSFDYEVMVKRFEPV